MKRLSYPEYQKQLIYIIKIVIEFRSVWKTKKKFNAFKINSVINKSLAIWYYFFNLSNEIRINKKLFYK